MAEIGYCYGSEWQLMRFLGHHREHLNECIRSVMGIKGNSAIIWEDYLFDKNRNAGDGEHKGVNIPFLKEKDTNIEEAWESFWTPSNKSMN